MVFDVIIPVYKPDEKLDALLAALLRQLHAPRAVILLITRDAGNDAEAEALAARLRATDARVKTRILDKAEYDHAGTRNLGVSLMEDGADLFLMMTQDAVPADDHLTEKLAEAFTDDQVAAAYARQLADRDAPIPEKCARRFNYPAESQRKTIDDIPRLGIKTYFCSNVCAMYKKDVFDKTGGFEAPAIFNEDMVYAARVLKEGYAIVYEAKAQVTHTHRYSLKTQYLRSFDNGASQAIHADVFSGIRTEDEGSRYVRETIRTLMRVRQGNRIPYFLLQCAYRYAGFRKGKRYQSLSLKQRKRCSLNADYWDRAQANGDQASWN
ncbi:MAG: glycosyltransferase [Butyrivibrio sp.]|nr:glycosyltransferase [Butyrivibrio sp.]